MKLATLLRIPVLCVLCSCTAVKVKSVDPTDTLREFRQDILSSDTLSPFSLQALRMAGITQQQALEDGIDEADRLQFEKFASPVDKAYVESELAIGRA